jgi:hypothetical protein
LKIKLAPELAYLIGFWRKRRSPEGLGVYGDESQLMHFTKLLLEMNIAPTEKIQTIEDKVLTYNTAYRKFFQEVEEEQLERFKYLNEYAANYLAGIFDSVGGITEKGVVYMTKMNAQDEMLLLRLGFATKRTKDGLVICKPMAFLIFIKNYVKLNADHQAFKIVSKS